MAASRTANAPLTLMRRTIAGNAACSSVARTRVARSGSRPAATGSPRRSARSRPPGCSRGAPRARRAAARARAHRRAGTPRSASRRATRLPRMRATATWPAVLEAMDRARPAGTRSGTERTRRRTPAAARGKRAGDRPARDRRRADRAAATRARQVGLAFAAEVERGGLAGLEAKQAGRRDELVNQRLGRAVNLPQQARLTGFQGVRILRHGAKLRRPRRAACGGFPAGTGSNAMDGNGASGDVRSTWTLEEVRALHALPFSDLMHRAQSVHRRHFDPNAVQVSTLLSIKTGACPEDCAYCPQSIRYDTGLERESLMDADEVVARARARARGGRDALLHGRGMAKPEGPRPRQGRRDGRGRRRARPRDLRHARHAHARAGEAAQGRRPRLLQPQPRHLRGLLRRGHHDPHLPGPPRHARRRARRPASTSAAAASSAWARQPEDRVAFLHTLATLDPHPESVPINNLVQVPGTPLAGTPALDPIEFVRIVALARILMPRSHVRLSAGRRSDERRAAGALLPRRRELHLLRRKAADHRQP